MRFGYCLAALGLSVGSVWFQKAYGVEDMPGLVLFLLGGAAATAALKAFP